MEKIIVFGATTSALELIHEYNVDVVAFCDNNEKKWGGYIDGKEIISPDSINAYAYDRIVIASFSALEPILKQLLEMGIPRDKIDGSLVEHNVEARGTFLKSFAQLANERAWAGAVAEAGVFQGEFAKEINKCFPKRRLYLFDTFEGFDDRDTKVEREMQYSLAEAGHLDNTSVELVMSKMPYPEIVEIKKGYFPDTALGISESFIFVNLDLDLYKPTIGGLRFFYPRMIPGGIILVHDFFGEGYNGIRNAIEEFEAETENVIPFPIGDGWSIAIQRH